MEQSVIFFEKRGGYFETLWTTVAVHGIEFMAPLTGLEPVTYGLTVRRSTD